jgi:hypothetical protein
MVARAPAKISDLTRRRTRRRAEGDERLGRIRLLAHQLGETVANAADADQWNISVDDVVDGGYTFPLPPRPILRSLHGGRGGVHEVSIALRADVRQIGNIHLLTIRPEGFPAEALAQARSAADCAARLLTLALDKATDPRPDQPEEHVEGHTHGILRLPVPEPWQGVGDDRAS